MTSAEFIARWGAFVRQERKKAGAAGVPEVADDFKLVRAPRKLLEVASFPKEAALFLVNAGLPKTCSPFLSFEAIAEGPLPLVRQPGVDKFPPDGRSRLASFYVIGSDGAGNPLCVDIARSGEIVMLDHEDDFRTRTFVASSVVLLAEALIVLHTFPYGEFLEHLRACDPRAADKTSFFPAQAAP